MKKWVSGLMAVCLLLCATTPVQADAAALTFNRDSLIPVRRPLRNAACESRPRPARCVRGAIFTISDETIASVNEDGKVRGLQVGPVRADCHQQIRQHR